MKKAKALKGFTFLEMVIVLALFTIIMYSLAQVLDPVSKYFTRSSNFESTTACIDNMKRVIEGNLKYADRVRTYVNYDPDETLDSNVESFYNEFFDSRMILDDHGVIYALVFDNSVPGIGTDNQTLTLTKTGGSEPITEPKEVAENNKNSGKITLYAYAFNADPDTPNVYKENQAPILMDEYPKEWYVNPKMYGNFEYQFKLGAYTDTFAEDAFDPSDFTISIMAYEIVKDRSTGTQRLIVNPTSKNASSSFSMKNVLEASSGYTSAREDLKIGVNATNPDYWRYVIDSRVLRFRGMTVNPSTEEHEDDNTVFHAKSLKDGSQLNSFYFIYTIPDTVYDSDDSDYFDAVHEKFEVVTPP